MEALEQYTAARESADTEHASESVDDTSAGQRETADTEKWVMDTTDEVEVVGVGA